MNTKHLYDSAEGLVLKSLRGAVALNPSIQLHAPSKTVYVKEHSSHKRVAVISGGGSGHEPAHAGYTGKGMLSACVAGDIFASPSAKQILNTIRLAAIASIETDTDAGGRTEHDPLDVLVIINNYTGDHLNFGLAIEKARASPTLSGVKIESVIVADDISLLRQNATNKFVGPRGLAANILVCKILGAFAECGETLARVKALGDAVVGNLYSLGVGLEHCHVPGRTKAGRALGEGECEVGLGLHNEPGVVRREIGEPGELIGEMVSMLLGSGGRERENAGSGETVDEESLVEECRGGMVLFINNLGGMSQLEMGAIVDDVLLRFAINGILPKRVYCSSYMTSLNAPGFSISILNIPGTMHSFHKILGHTSNISIEDLLDAPTDASAWVGSRTSWPAQTVSPLSAEPRDEIMISHSIDHDAKIIDNALDRLSAEPQSTRTYNAIREACRRVIQVHEQLTEFDTVVGDGDCGDTFKAGASAVMNAIDRDQLSNQSDISAIVYEIAEILEDSMGGTIGALLAIFLHGLAVSLRKHTREGQEYAVKVLWGRALQDAKETLSRYTPAEIGDRTIIDALGPFCSRMAQSQGEGGSGDQNQQDNEKEGLLSNFEEAVRKARVGAERTRGMIAHLGRAAYIGVGSSTTASELSLPPDPGAWGICAALEGLLDGITRRGFQS